MSAFTRSMKGMIANLHDIILIIEKDCSIVASSFKIPQYCRNIFLCHLLSISLVEFVKVSYTHGGATVQPRSQNIRQ